MIGSKRNTCLATITETLYNVCMIDELSKITFYKVALKHFITIIVSNLPIHNFTEPCIFLKNKSLKPCILFLNINPESNPHLNVICVIVLNPESQHFLTNVI